MLSNIDILEEIGINIYIYPFRKSNLKGASYNLTASILGWDINTKKTIYDKNQNKLIIQPHTTALIETNEAIWVSPKIAGTYHSKVALVSKGLTHISTTLDPEYVGSSLIAVHNLTDKPISLTPEVDTFATLKLHYVNSEASVRAGNNPGRPDVLLGFDISDEDKAWLDQDFRNIPDSLKSKLKECPDYLELIAQRNSKEQKIKTAERQKRQARRKKRRLIIINLISSIMLFSPLALAGVLSANKEKFEKSGWYDPFVNSLYGISSVAMLTLITVNYQLFEGFSDDD